MPKAIYPNSRVQNHGFKNKMLARTGQKTQRGTKILDLVKNGEKFGALCKKRSIDSGSAKRDGNLGYFGRGMVKPFEEAALLQVGQISAFYNPG